MKRNWYLIRSILLAVESAPDGIVGSDQFDEPRALVLNHFKLLIDGGLVAGWAREVHAPADEQGEYLTARLTWKGAETLDAIRDEAILSEFERQVEMGKIDATHDTLMAFSLRITEAALNKWAAE